MKKIFNLANLITIIRVVCSILILTFDVFSKLFYIFYIIAGLSDIFDGFIARITRTESKFGSKLDSFSDFIFIVVCSIKIFPIMQINVKTYLWIGIIALIKTINIIFGFAIQKEIIAFHSIPNKITGLILYLFPLIINYFEINLVCFFVCAMASFSAIYENYYIINTKQIK